MPAGSHSQQRVSRAYAAGRRLIGSHPAQNDRRHGGEHAPLDHRRSRSTAGLDLLATTLAARSLATLQSLDV